MFWRKQKHKDESQYVVLPIEIQSDGILIDLNEPKYEIGKISKCVQVCPFCGYKHVVYDNDEGILGVPMSKCLKCNN